MPDSIVPQPENTAPPGTARNVVATTTALGVLGLLVVIVGAEYGWRLAALATVGGLLGLTLYHASFGFTSAWRAFVFERRGAGLRAQMVMLAIAVAMFFPILGAGEIFGRSINGFVFPVGISVAVGSFIFGIGMQLGGGCASGTLYTAGGGNTRMVVTLAAFIAGSLLATFNLPWWLDQPSLGSFSLVRIMGWPIALAANLVVFGLIYWLVSRRSVDGKKPLGKTDGSVSLVRGPWPLLWGAVGLAVLNAATLILAGRPWGITSGFALWGGKIADTAGFDLSPYAYWAARQGLLERSLLADTTSVMNFGIILGAMAAAGLAGRFAPGWRLPWRGVMTAIIGGLLMGYGARLAFGCNIGAYFSGVASGSLHGWLWLVCGFVGSIIGTHVRRLMKDGPYAAGIPSVQH
ncbi:MAG: YeeE/YedE family protein [Pseudomonadota bacterium]